VPSRANELGLAFESVAFENRTFVRRNYVWAIR
jgi:hypothetical protein